MYLNNLSTYELFLYWSLAKRQGFLTLTKAAYKEIDRRANILPFEVIAQRLQLNQKGITTKN